MKIWYEEEMLEGEDRVRAALVSDALAIARVHVESWKTS